MKKNIQIREYYNWWWHLSTGYPILIDRSKYLLKYAICKKIVLTKIVNDSGVIFLYSWPWTSGKVSRSFEGQGHFIKWKPLFWMSDSKSAGNFTLKIIFLNLLLWPWEGTIKVKLSNCLKVLRSYLFESRRYLRIMNVKGNLSK